MSIVKSHVVNSHMANGHLELGHSTNGYTTNGHSPNGHLTNGHAVHKGDTYTLMRDCSASSRLTAQHYVWKDLFGFLIHPDIPTKAADLKVADIATGNGIWLHDAARNLPPSAELHGFDISLDQVGPKAWLPANMHMHTWNFFEEPAREFIGYFDVVHVRLVTVVVHNSNAELVLANLAKLLKPGGYLQWDEISSPGASWLQTVPGVSGEYLEKLYNQLRHSQRHDTWKYHLTQVMDRSGFTGSRLYTFVESPHMARFWQDTHIGAWKELAAKVLKTPEESSELEQRAMEEVRQGAACVIPKLVWVGKKL